MRNNHGEGRSQAAPRQESSDIIGARHFPDQPLLVCKLIDFSEQRNVTIATRLRRLFGARTTKARRCAMRTHPNPSYSRPLLITTIILFFSDNMQLWPVVRLRTPFLLALCS